MDGGTLTFQIDDQPGETFGKDENDRPVSVIRDHSINTAPFIREGEQMYISSVGLSCLQDIGSWIFADEMVFK